MRPSRFNPIRTVDGFGSDVLPHPYHMPATPTPRRNSLAALALNSAASRARSLPSRPQRLEAGTNSYAFAEHLPSHSWSIVRQARSECETPADPFQCDPPVRHTVALAQSPPGERRIRETLPPVQCWCARHESAPGSVERGTALKHAPARAPQPSVPRTNTRPC